LLVDFDLAVKYQELAGFEAAFQVSTMEKFAGKEAAGGVLHQEMIDGVATVAPHGTDGLAAHDFDANGVDAVRLNVADVRKMDAIFVPEWKIGEEVFESVQAALGQKFGALRPDSFDHANFGGESQRRHAEFFIPE
jgi:hypothetical protein